jgi:hypothetical protein
MHRCPKLDNMRVPSTCMSAQAVDEITQALRPRNVRIELVQAAFVL